LKLYFQQQRVTWPHQDTYYLDTEEIERMTAAGVAVEDMGRAPGGCFCYPKSHLPS
jgi:phytanoyl-CoA hydroxylase